MMETAAPTPQRHAPPPIDETEVNKITMNIRGDLVMVSGLLDLKGLRLLKKKITGLEAIVTPDDEDLDDHSETKQ